MFLSLFTAIIYLVANVSGKCTSQVYEFHITAFENGLLNVNNFNLTQGWKNDTDQLDVYSISSSLARISASTATSAWHTLLTPCSSDISTEYEYLQLIVRGPILKNTKVIVKTVDDCTISNPVISSHEFDLSDISYSEYEGDFVAVQIPLLLFNPEIPNPSHMREIILTNLLPVTDTLSLVRISLLRVNTTCVDQKPQIPGMAWKKDGVLMIDDKPFRFLGFSSFQTILYMLDHEMDQYIRTVSIYANGTSAVLHIPAIVDACTGTCLVTGYRQYNEARLKRLDKLLYYAAKYGVKIAISFMRGRHESFQNYCGFHSCIRYDSSFYTSFATKESFKHFLNHTMSRRNTVTGILYKDDPAIFYWSFGTELLLEESQSIPPISWVAEMAEFVKSIDSNHLLNDGYNRVDANYLDIFTPMKLWAIQNLDIHSHFFADQGRDRHIEFFKRGVKLGSNFKKIYIVAQLVIWIDNPTDVIRSFTEICYAHFFKVGHEYNSSPAAGAFIYQLKAQSKAFSKFEIYGHFYPGTSIDSKTSQELLTYLRTKAKWLDMTSKGIQLTSDPEPFPIPPIDPPLIFNISQTSDFLVEIDWYGPISGINISFYKSYDNLNFVKVDEVPYGTNQPYIDILINVTSDCPIPYYYKLIAENKEFKMISPPAFTSIIYRPSVIRKNASECSKQLITSTLSGINNEGYLTVLIVATSAGISLAVVISYISFKYFKRPKSSDRLHLDRQTPIDAENTFSHTINNTYTMELFVPGYLELQLRDISFDSTPIGAGLTSSVYKGSIVSKKLLAKHGAIEIAVKALKDNGPENAEDSTTDFMYEIAILSRLPRSPYLLEFVGYMKAPKPSIVMKYYKCSLKDLIINTETTLNSEIVEKIAIDIATGIYLIHKSNILHLDIKPHNVLLDIFPNSTFNCVISDFGFSSLIGDDSGKQSKVSGLQEPKTAGITVRYAAPELFLKMKLANSRLNQEEDKKIDVYAWAITIFEVIERRNAWDHQEFNMIRNNVQSGLRPTFLPENREKYSSIKHLFDLVEAAWSHHHIDRPDMELIIDKMTRRVKELEPITGNNTTNTVTSLNPGLSVSGVADF